MPTLEKNHWLDTACAKAFWDQQVALPYQELLQDTAQFLDVRPGARWLDLGCGCGQLTAMLWHQSEGQVAEIVAMDCNGANAAAIEKLQRRLQARPGRIGFMVGNFSDGLPQLADQAFDGIVSGLAISYAESRDPVTGQYTDEAYDHLLTELHRVLKPDGQLVFSVNVPRVRFWPIFWKSLRRAFSISKPAKALVNGLRMQRYGRWLQHEARRGRFHYFPIEEIAQRLRQAGFPACHWQLSYAGQAYVVAARKPEAE